MEIKRHLFVTLGEGKGVVRKVLIEINRIIVVDYNNLTR
jgi:hypothetical protein